MKTAFNDFAKKREFVTDYGRDMFKTPILTSYSDRGTITDLQLKKEYENNFGFLVGDIVSIVEPGDYLNGLDLEITKLVNKPPFNVLVEFKFIDPETGKKAKEDYDIYQLRYAILVKPVGDLYVSDKETSNKSKYILEVEDFKKSKEDWKKEMYEDGINIGITVWLADDEDCMFDQDVLSELPELEEIYLGEIVSDEDGFLGLESELSLAKIKQVLKKAGFKLK